MKDRSKARPAKWKVPAWAALALLCCAGFANARPPLPPPSDWWVLIEPKFMRPPVAVAVPGSQRTVLAAGFTDALDVEIMSREQFGRLDVGWDVFARRATENAERFLGTLEPKFTRDGTGVIQFATISSDRPLVAAAALAPGFAKRFADTLGPEFLVAVPNRYLVYAFPKLASHYREYAPMVLDAYDATPYPVSLEVFEVTRDSFRAIGVYERP